MSVQPVASPVRCFVRCEVAQALVYGANFLGSGPAPSIPLKVSTACEYL